MVLACITNCTGGSLRRGTFWSQTKFSESPDLLSCFGANYCSANSLQCSTTGYIAKNSKRFGSLAAGTRFILIEFSLNVAMVCESKTRTPRKEPYHDARSAGERIIIVC